jgi:Skp family chaperone for outer membrane proteins
MKDIRFLQLGWVIAAAFVAVTVASGFQNGGLKIGVVDISKVVENSEFGKQNQEAFLQMKTAREGVLEFIDNNRVLTAEQAQKLRDLSLKPQRTANENAELESIRADVTAAFKRSQELATKTTLTSEERTLMEEYANRSQRMNDIAQRWFREFSNEMQGWADKQKIDSLDRARSAVQTVAKAEGYTVVLEVGIAPYGANDLSDAALAAMNAKK